MIFRSAVSIAPRLRPQAKLSAAQALSRPVSANDDACLAHTGYRKLGWRQLRRAIHLRLSGQEKYGESKILPAWKCGLWFYKGVPQIGDALTNLAPRCLLAEHRLTMDLYTDEHLADLFSQDPWFDRVMSDPEDIRDQNYDFVIFTACPVSLRCARLSRDRSTHRCRPVRPFLHEFRFEKQGD